MKGRKILMAVAIGLLLTAGYQVNAQMDEATDPEMMGGHARCKTMIDKGMDGMRHKMMNKMMGDHMGNADLSPEMQVEVDSIKAKYQDDLNSKELVIDAKMADLDNAWADESTTVGEINLIQADLQVLKGEYQQVKIKMNQEIGAKIGTTMMKDGSYGCMKHGGKCDTKACNMKDCDKMKACDKMKECDKKACKGKKCGGKSGGHGPMMHGSM